MNALQKIPGKYDEIWSLIKRNGECSLTCNPAARKSITQGVKRAKYKDIEFKFANEHETLYLDIFWTEQSSEIGLLKFVLRQFPGLEEIVIV